MINLAKGKTPEELNFFFTLKELKEIASDLKIEGRSKMNKITLCLNIEDVLTVIEELKNEGFIGGN